MDREPALIHGTIHYFATGHHRSSCGNIPIDHPNTGFNVYAAEWTPDHIDLLLNDHPYFHFDIKNAYDQGANPFRKPHFIILNPAIGGSWGGPIDDSIFPQRMTIDYVRVYQKLQPAP